MVESWESSVAPLVPDTTSPYKIDVSFTLVGYIKRIAMFGRVTRVPIHPIWGYNRKKGLSTNSITSWEIGKF